LIPSEWLGWDHVELHEARIVARLARSEHSAVLFRPENDQLDCCENVYEDWCPNSNLFLSRTQATTSADERGIPGRVMGFDEASEIGTRDWADVVEAQG